jgi:2-dehydropantoate 2-reductase
VPVWEKFIILVSAAGFTGAARLPIGPLRSDDRIRAQFLAACAEIERLARAEGVPVAADILQQVSAYIDRIPASMRSSLLIDLSLGKRIEVETLQGSVVRRAERAGVETPIIGTLYAVLKPWASGAAPAG